MKTRLRVEFHCHTIYSPDSLTRPEQLIRACRHKGIDRVVVTDHNTIAGALAAQKLDPDRVIVGEEIMTREGELLAAYVREEIPKGLPALKAIGALREQGAFISVSHPFDRTRRGHWKLTDLEMIAPLVDALEIFNARCLSPEFDRLAGEFARAHGLPGTAGSDAHGTKELGQAVVLLPPFEDAEGLRNAIREAEYELSHSSPWTRLISRWAVTARGLGLVDPPMRKE
jgi:predicted metal-dependent phosphoesterase TrpH